MRDFDEQVSSLLKEEEDKPWGDYAFAADRVDVPREPNTEVEAAAKEDLNDHFEGSYALSAKQAAEMKALIKRGLYTDVLQLPKSITVVYRGMSLDPSTLLELIDELDPDAKGWQNVSVTLKPRKGRATASWSVDYDSARDFATKEVDDFAVAVVFAARVSDNPDAFIINPEKIYNVQDWSELELEQETIGIGPIKVSSIILL